MIIRYRQLQKETKEVNSLEFGLTSNKGNGTLTFESGRGGEYSYGYTEKNSGDYKDIDMLLTAYSFDNKNWVTNFDKVNLKEGKTIYLRFQKAKEDSETKTDSDFYFAQDSNFTIYDITYSGLHYGCIIDFLTNEVDISLQSEKYH